MHDCDKVDAELARLRRQVELIPALQARLEELEKLLAELTTQPQPGRDPPAWAKAKNPSL